MLQVDRFRKTDPAQCTQSCYVLTHAHLDHGVFSKTFPCVVYCTAITKYLVKCASETETSIQLHGTLKEWEWCDVGSQRIYCFPNAHCIGSLGFYSPADSLLYFGEGRPSQATYAHLKEIVSEVPPSAQLRIVTDDFFATNLPHIDTRVMVPTEKQSRARLRAFLRARLHGKHTIHLRVAHFGVLNVLPRLGSRVRYTWAGKVLGCGARLTEAAFDLLFGDHFSAPDAKQIYVSRVHAKDVLDIPQPSITLFLTAMWFFVEPHHLKHLSHIVETQPNVFHLCVCAHATPKEVAAQQRAFA